MLIREFTFGDTPCFVQVRDIPRPGGAPSVYTAELYVLENARRELRRIGDHVGKPVEVPADSTQEALNRAATYLYERFGPLTNAAMARHVERSVRLINEPPLRIEVSLAVHRQVRTPGEVLPQQAVGVLVGPAPPRTLRVAEEDLHARRDREGAMSREFQPAIPRQRGHEPSGKSLDAPRERPHDRLRFFPGDPDQADVARRRSTKVAI